MDHLEHALTPPAPAEATAQSRGLGVALLRWCGAGLLVGTAAVHLDLYVTGYDAVPTIGTLFVLQAVAALGFAATAVVAGRLPRLIGALVLALGAGFSLATLCGYLITLRFGLFGFKEVRTEAGIAAAVLEIAAFVALGLAAAALLGGGGRRVGGAAVPSLALVASLICALGLAGAGSTATPAGRTAGATAAAVAAEVRGYGMVLATPALSSLYLLSNEAGDRIACTGGCLSLWPPLLVRSGTPLRGGAGVLGRLGRVRRAPGVYQLTYNGYPLYRYVGDTGRLQSSGEGVVSNGGTWYLVRASSRTPGGTPVTSGSR